jgi:hypothetical protein
MSKRSALLIVIVCLATVLASSAHAQNNSGANDAALKGNYAFSFTGFTGSGGNSAVFAAAGRFTADGAGNVTNGELDSNGVGAGAVLTAQPFTGTYTIGADNRGTMTLNIAGSASQLAFAMTANGNAQFIEFDAAGGTGTIGSGTMEKADTAAYSTAAISGDYAFGLAGFDASSNRAAFAGRVTADGAGNFTNGAGDLNGAGNVGSTTFAASSYTVSDTTNGRGTANLSFSFCGTAFTLNFAAYVVNSGKLFLMETDSLAGPLPLLSGTLIQQQTPAGGFSNASLNGGIVLSLTGRTTCGGGAAAPDIILGLLTADGNGGFTLSFDENCGGTSTSNTGLSGTSTVAANGRVVLSLGTLTQISYLVSTNQVFFLGTDASVFLGPGDAQAAGSFTNSSVTRNYAGFSSAPATFGVNVFSGEFTADGASPTGNLTGAMDIGDANGPASGQAFSATYSISSSPTNGRGSLTITSGSGGSALAYVISPSKFVVLPTSDPNPSVWVFEQAPSSSTPPTVSLSSLTLSPATVVGGSQSSTGTVTLSAAAPSGGAQVALSSSDTTTAQVPSSVTVPAGATSATFTVTTSAVATSTSVTISASFGGVTQTASLTVTPQPPPSPTLASLTVSPATVVGGSQSSTGTVTLSAAAPSGGAQVALSSSDTAAAQVPSSVTIPAGSTWATFTVTTSAVATSTWVTISASFGGVTQTASLTVTPPPPPPPPSLTSLTLNPSSVIGGPIVGASTGTVTLSAPAPSGGAQVALSSSNSGVANVPSSVFVSAGSTKASFGVNTSIVLSSTNVTISASYNGTTKQANLAVNAPLSLVPPLL